MIRSIIAWTVCCALWAADDVDALKKRIVEFEREMTLSLPAAAGGQYSFTRTHGGGSSSSSGTYSGLPAQARLLAPLIPKRFGGTLEDAAAGQPAGGHGAHDF